LQNDLDEQLGKQRYVIIIQIISKKSAHNVSVKNKSKREAVNSTNRAVI
jgi:hypothetical protein